MASTLKRVSENTERAITTIANRESRTFVAQLDIVVEAGLAALGEQPAGTTPTEPATEPAAPAAPATSTE